MSLLFIVAPGLFSPIVAIADLPSFKSEYEITLGNLDKARLPGKTYVDKASGYLLIDWINNCRESWVTSQRMMTKFINSHGVGTVNEINYSLNEASDGKKMEFVLEIKDNAEVIERHFGNASKNKNLEVTFNQSDKVLNFPGDVIFPHQFLNDIIENLYSDKNMIVRNVYEGTIPDKFFNISVFFIDQETSIDRKLVPNGVVNKFKKIRMAYYQDKSEIPVFEQTIHLNKQGIASFFRYDYPDYSLELNLKKVELTPLDCSNR
tara:strand:- start:558 stop:1346 length:789 start_codon:yes stop_codon:yes gene_type:complete